VIGLSVYSLGVIAVTPFILKPKGVLTMETAIEQWKRDFLAEEKAINGSKLLKEEKVAKIASTRAKNWVRWSFINRLTQF
jgi:hypothetical protein